MESERKPEAALTSPFEQRKPELLSRGGMPLDMNSVPAPGIGMMSRSSSASGGGAQHPNIFVRGLPLTWSEAEIMKIFQQYGNLSSIRLVRHSITKQSLGYGFVRYQEISEAQASINGLDGTTILGHTLQVKFADADAGPPSSGGASGQTPSDCCYVKHIPANYVAEEVQLLFEEFGTVLDIKMFPCLDPFRGASALVRMATIDSAGSAITALNNFTPPGAVQSLIVRFAESATEKAARVSRRERQQLLQHGNIQGALSSGTSGTLEQLQLQQAINALGLDGLSLVPSETLPGLVANNRSAVSIGQMQPPHLVSVQSSVCVKGMPSTADRLWMYENFSQFGAIIGLRILIDETSGLCNGIGFINYADPGGAYRARQMMHGINVGEGALQVIIQNQGQQRYSMPGNVSVLSDNSSVGPSDLLTGSHNVEWQQLPTGGNAGMMW